MVAIIYSEKFLLHKTGEHHPERPERITAIVEMLRNIHGTEKIEWKCPTNVNYDLLYALLLKVHSQEYLQKVELIAKRGGGDFYGDTIVSPQSYEVALLALNAWLDAVDYALAKNEPAFAIARPPGHHALRDTGMGFCLFANAAIAAFHALNQPSVNRVAILDWDVHHGNGTQEAVENHPQIAFCSIHQAPFFPFTGREEEKGLYNNILNIRVKQGYTLLDYQPLFEQKVIPFLEDFQPDLLIVSAGYDANQADALGWVDLQPKDYGIFTNYCLKLTRRVVFGLEGGYELQSLAESVVETIASCLK